MLETEPAIATVIDPFLQAYANQTMEMLDGQIAGAKIPLARLSSPDLYYVLTGNDLDLHLNDPQQPAILCLGGNPTRMEALAPVLSLYIDRINRVCNQPGQHPFAVVCDEFATVRAASVLTTMATGRSNNIIPILAVQDLSQLRTLYSRDEAEWIMNVSANVLCGQVGGETARRISERFPKILREKASISVNGSDTSVSRHQEWETVVTPATVANLSAGEFLGILSDDPTQEMQLKAFQSRLVREKKDDGIRRELPIVREVDDGVLRVAYEQVRVDIEGIVVAVERGVMGGVD